MTQTAPYISIDWTRVADLRAEFAERHVVSLPQLIEPLLLSKLWQQISDSQASEQHWLTPNGKAFSEELTIPETHPSVRGFCLVLNSEQLFRFVEELTGCSKIGHFRGRIYILQPNSPHRADWHSDNDGTRMIGLSLNLSPGVFSGGLFQIRERHTENVFEIANTGFGAANLFQISPELEHRVTAVTGDVMRIALAGWFCEQPSVRELLIRGVPVPDD